MRTHLALVLWLASSGCATGAPPSPRIDAGRDSGFERLDGGRDSGPLDAGSIVLDSGIDAGPIDVDAGTDAGPDDAGDDAGDEAGADAGRDAGGDAGPEAGPVDAGPGCGVISEGHTIALDGAGDLAEYGPTQVLTPGWPLGAADSFALTWDPDYLYITLVSPAFDDPYKPLHVYLEARSVLGAAGASTGKEYGGLTPHLAFAPTHVIAVRRTSDSGTGGPYDGVYTGAAFTTRATPLDAGTDYWISTDNRTLSVRVRWAALGCPSALRLSAHVVNRVTANEWKDTVPAGATPWITGDGGPYYEIELSGDPAISGWTLRGS